MTPFSGAHNRRPFAALILVLVAALGLVGFGPIRPVSAQTTGTVGICHLSGGTYVFIMVDSETADSLVAQGDFRASVAADCAANTTPTATGTATTTAIGNSTATAGTVGVCHLSGSTYIFIVVDAVTADSLVAQGDFRASTAADCAANIPAATSTATATVTVTPLVVGICHMLPTGAFVFMFVSQADLQVHAMDPGDVIFGVSGPADCVALGAGVGLGATPTVTGQPIEGPTGTTDLPTPAVISDQPAATPMAPTTPVDTSGVVSGPSTAISSESPSSSGSLSSTSAQTSSNGAVGGVAGATTPLAPSTGLVSSVSDSTDSTGVFPLAAGVVALSGGLALFMVARSRSSRS